MGSVCKAVPRNVRLADGLVEYELETPVNVLFTGVFYSRNIHRRIVN